MSHYSDAFPLCILAAVDRFARSWVVDPKAKEKEMEPILISIPGAANALGLGRSKVYDLIGEGRLATVKIGRRNLVRADSVRALAEKGAAND